MKRPLSLLAAAILAAALGSTAAASPTTLTIPMKALNNSGENGTATLTDVADGVRVVVTLKGTPKGIDQPTHIHIGTCGNINKAPEYPLQNTSNGSSATVVRGVKLANLLAGHYAINVHKSGTDLGTYVSCGNIVAAK